MTVALNNIEKLFKGFSVGRYNQILLERRVFLDMLQTAEEQKYNLLGFDGFLKVSNGFQIDSALCIDFSCSTHKHIPNKYDYAANFVMNQIENSFFEAVFDDAQPASH